MDTESFAEFVYLDGDMADRIIAAQERMKANPPKQHTHKVKFATKKRIPTTDRNIKKAMQI